MSYVNAGLQICELINLLFEKAESVKQMKCCIGFDGFIDEIFRVVKERKSYNEYQPFDSIEDFSDHVRASAGKSADMEIVSQEIKLGGNAPIMSNAIASQGIKTWCIGALGMPETNKAFLETSKNCTLLSVANPAYTHAYEFDDGKLMFGSVNSLNEVNWENIKICVGLEKLIDIFDEASVIGIVNWKYINNMADILRGILDEIFPLLKNYELSKKNMFFDIADPSGRSKEELMEFLLLLGEFSKHTDVILGLNERETRLVYGCLRGEDCAGEENEESLAIVGKYIYDHLSISTLVIHTLNAAIGINKEKICNIDGFFVSKPLISTGGGDNFNAGFCVGQLLQMTIEQSLIMGNATSSYYVSNGYSPSYNELIGYLNLKL